MIGEHPIARARERYGLELTVSDLAAIARQIEGRRDAVVMRQSQSQRQVWGVKVQGIWAQVVYATSTKSVVTFLPPAAKQRRA